MSTWPIVRDSVPEIGDAWLEDFQVDVRNQRITLVATGSFEDMGPWFRLDATFEGVAYIHLGSEIPVNFHDNGINVFKELDDSAPLDSLVEHQGWQTLRTSTWHVILSPPGLWIELRHFVLQSSWLAADWLCQRASLMFQPGSNED